MLSTLTLIGSGTSSNNNITSITATDGGAGITPTPGALLFAHVGGRNIDGSLAVTGVSSVFATENGWTLVAEWLYSENANVPVGSLWMAVAAAEPGSGTVTAALSPGSSRAAIAVYEMEGQHLVTPIRQHKAATHNSSADFSVTLDEEPAGDAAILGFFTGQSVSAIAPGTGFTETAEVNSGGGTQILIQSQYNMDPEDGTCTWTGTQSGRMLVGIVVEVLADDGEPIPDEPIIRSATEATGTVWTPFTYQATATGLSPKTWSIGAGGDPLPAGLSLDPDTGLISGTPTETGETEVELVCTNSAGADSILLTITIEPEPLTGTFSMLMGAGGATATSVRLRARTTAAALLQFAVSTESDLSDAVLSEGVYTSVAYDYCAAEEITELSPSTRYYYTPVVGGVPALSAPYPSFTTFPAENDTSGQIKLINISCQGNPNGPGFASVAAEEPTLVGHQGDFGYHSSNVLSTQRSALRTQYGGDFGTHIARRSVVFRQWDDHDYGPNNSHGRTPGKENSLRAYKEYSLGYDLENPDNGIWQAIRVGGLAEIFALDCRYQRESNRQRFPTTSTKTADTGSGGSQLILRAADAPSNEDEAYYSWYAVITTGEGTFYRRVSAYDAETRTCTLSGADREPKAVPGLDDTSTYYLRYASMLDMDWIENDQVAWLIGRMRSSTAIWKVIYSTVVWNVGDPGDGWNLFPEERGFILEECAGVKNVLVLSGDAHYGAIDDGANSGWPELLAGPINEGSHAGKDVWSNGYNDDAALDRYGVLTLSATEAVLEVKDHTGALVAGITPLTVAAEDAHVPPEEPEEIALGTATPESNYQTVYAPGLPAGTYEIYVRDAVTEEVAGPHTITVEPAPPPDPGVRLLDEHSPALHYSLALDRTGYDGPVLLVQRASDNAEMDIGFTASGTLDTAALEAFMAGEAEGRVMRWYSQQAGVPDAVAASYVSAPYIWRYGEICHISGQAAVYFDKGCYLTITGHAPVSRHACTIMATAQGAFPGEHSHLIQTAGGIYFQFGKYWNCTVHTGETRHIGQPYNYNRATVVGLRASEDVVRLYRNLSLKQTYPAATTDASSTTTTLGNSSASSGRFYVSSIAVFDEALSDADQDAVYGFLNREGAYGPTVRVAPPAGQWSTDFQEGIAALGYLQRLTLGDVEITPQPITWTGGDWTGREDELATLREMWRHQEIAPAHDALSTARHYIADDGAGAGVLGSGVVRVPIQNEGSHLYLLGENAAFLYATSLPDADGNECNPYYQNPAMGRRAVSIMSAWLGCHWKGLDGNIYHGQSIFVCKVLKCIGVTYHLCHDVLTEGEKVAWKHYIIALLSSMSERAATGGTFNMAAAGLEGAGAAYAACVGDETPTGRAIRRLAPRAVRMFLFGRPDGTIDNSALGRLFFAAGYLGESHGFDASYGGYSYGDLVALAALVHGDEAWDFLVPVVEAMARIKTHAYAPNPYGSYWGMGAGYCVRTGDDLTNQLGTFPSREQVAAYIAVNARPLFRTETPEEMASGIQTSLNRINTTSAEKSFQTGGLGGALHDGTAEPWGMGALWPQSLNLCLPASTGWYTTLKAMRDANDPSFTFPIERGDHSVLHGEPGQDNSPEFWSYRATGADERAWAMFVEALNRAEDSSERPNYDGWFGGKIEALWVEGMGNVLDNRHGKTGGGGSGDPSYEDSRRWSMADRWAVMGVHGFQALPVASVSDSDVHIAGGDYTALFKAGTSVWIADANDNSRGERMVSDVAFVGGETVLTLADASNVVAGSQVVWGFSTALAARQGQTSVFETDGATPKVTITSRHGAGVGTHQTLAGSGEVTGILTVETVIEALENGPRVTYTVSADAAAQAADYFPNLFATIPVLLNDPSQSGVEATIEVDTDGWAFATTSPVLTQHLRIGRGGEYVYVTLDEPRLVWLSPIYQQTYQDNKRLRRINVDMHPSHGTPALLPATTTLSYHVSTVDDTGVEGEVVSVAVIKPTPATVVPQGEVAGVYLQVQGGAAPYAAELEVTTNGTDFMPLPGMTLREVTTGFYELVGDPTAGGVWPAGGTGFRVAVTDAEEGSATTAPVAITTSAPPVLVVEDTFTDAPGTLLSGHTPDAGTWTTVPAAQIGAEGDTLVPAGVNNARVLYDANTLLQIAEARCRHNAGAAIYPGPAARSRLDTASTRMVAYRTGTTLVINQTGTEDRVLDGLPAVALNEWYTVRLVSLLDHVIAVCYDATGAYVATAGLWALDASHQDASRDGAGVDFGASGTAGECDYVRVYTYA